MGIGRFPLYVQLLVQGIWGQQWGWAWAGCGSTGLYAFCLVLGRSLLISAKQTAPSNKGYRQTPAIAFHDTYGQSVVFSGPIYRMHRIKGSKVIVDFDHVHGGLVTHGGTDVVGFEIAGRDKVFHSAKAIIQGNQVIVTSTEVSKPKAVRYAWADDPRISNLFNREGFPAAPFRTDKWTPITKNVKYGWANRCNCFQLKSKDFVVGAFKNPE